MPNVTVSAAIDTLLQSADKPAARTALSIPPLEVATNAAKLALTDIVRGQEVLVSGEANRLEKFVGDGTYSDADADVKGFTITGPSDGSQGAYVETEEVLGKAAFVKGDFIVNWGGTFWRVRDAEAGDNLWVSNEDVSYPWEVTSWQQLDGTGSPPTFSNFVGTWTGAGADDDANWEIIGANTVELLFTGDGDEAGGETLEGAAQSGVAVSLGWFPEGYVTTYVSPSSTYVIDNLETYLAGGTIDDFYDLQTAVPNQLGGQGVLTVNPFFIPYGCAKRGQVYLSLIRNT